MGEELQLVFEFMVCLFLPGDLLVMTAVNMTAENVYVSKVVLNGRQVDMKQPFVNHSGT